MQQVQQARGVPPPVPVKSRKMSAARGEEGDRQARENRRVGRQQQGSEDHRG